MSIGKLGRVAILAGVAFVLGSLALIFIVYFWPPRYAGGPESQRLPDPSSFPGGTFPNGSQLVWEDGEWVVSIEPRVMYTTNFPANFSVAIQQGQSWQFNFELEDPLLLPTVYIRTELLAYAGGPGNAEMTVTVMQSGGQTLLSQNVDIPPGAEDFELSLPAGKFESSGTSEYSVRMHVTAATQAVSVASVRIVNDK